MRHNDYHNNNSNNSFVTFIAGALAGVAAVLFLDKDMRTKVGDKLIEARDKGEETMEQAKAKLQETKGKVVEMADEKLMEAHERLEEEKDDTGTSGTRRTANRATNGRRNS